MTKTRWNGIDGVGDAYTRTPALSFERCDKYGPFGWANAADRDLRRIREFLGGLKMLKLGEIFGERRRGNHRPRPDQLGQPAQDRLKVLRLAPERLASLRLTKRERIWAVVDGSVLALLWWDPLHQVWPRRSP